MNWNSKVSLKETTLIALITLILGSLAGWWIYKVRSNHSYYASLHQVMNIVEKNYVDSINMEKISSNLIPALLSSLDPHSTYIPREESINETERLEGSFFGIGVTFNTVIDTPVVVSVIPNGPAERAGLKAGDRILKAGNKNLLIDSLNSEKVRSILLGSKGTVVDLSILRNNKVLEVGVTRDAVPIKSVDVAYMLDKTTGLIHIQSWTRNTHSEFLAASEKLKNQGAKKLVIDLRNNLGGYLTAAVSLANEFLKEGQLIVYSKGLHFPEEMFYADGTGKLKDVPLAILVNELTASSSEIFAGAMQDHDRATIVGRRTFGKGLVQRPFFLSDSSQIRLTVARYYTPSGRCIQKKYTMGDQEDYNKDLDDRFRDGELEHVDSSLFVNAPKYHTDKGRVIYGECGIMPDIFVPKTQPYVNDYAIRLINSGLIPEFAFKYADKNRKSLEKYTTPNALWARLKMGDDIVQLYANYAAQRGIQKRPNMLYEAHALLEQFIAAQIAQFFLGEEGFYEIAYYKDKTIEAAVKALEK